MLWLKHPFLRNVIIPVADDPRNRGREFATDSQLEHYWQTQEEQADEKAPDEMKE